MQKILFIFAILLVLTAASHAQEYYFPFGKQRHYPSVLDSPKYYFPLTAAYYGHAMPDTAAVIRRSVQLKALQEPILFNNNTQDEIFRFTWLRSADHPVAIRMVLHEEHVTLYWKESDGSKVIIDRQKALDNSAWRHLRKLAEQINNCKIDTGYIPSPGKSSEWLMELAMHGFYHVDAITSPGPNSSYYKCCDYLIGLTDLKIEEGGKY